MYLTRKEKINFFTRRSPARSTNIDYKMYAHFPLQRSGCAATKEINIYSDNKDIRGLTEIAKGLSDSSCSCWALYIFVTTMLQSARLVPGWVFSACCKAEDSDPDKNSISQVRATTARCFKYFSSTSRISPWSWSRRMFDPVGASAIVTHVVPPFTAGSIR